MAGEKEISTKLRKEPLKWRGSAKRQKMREAEAYMS